MGKNSKIEWTHHTFNPWWGCVKIAPECKFCYAERDAKRYGHDVWGPDSARRFLSEDHWAQPLKWDRAARDAGERHRVFCASMADVFEDHPALPAVRERLWKLIEATPNLDWLLLTKRPENMRAMIPATWLQTPPRNVWYGTTAGCQASAIKNIPHLLAVPGVVHFVSAEPLLEAVNFKPYLSNSYLTRCPGSRAAELGSIDWLIVGGESGHGARAMQPSWVHGILLQCRAAGAAFFFKQWGEWGPVMNGVHGFYTGEMCRLGKKDAGRLLNGLEFDEIPKVGV